MEESKKRTTLNRFPCTSVCKFLDLETNLCKIYESRPLICRIDEVHKKIYSHIPLKEFYTKNAEVCNALQETNHMDISFRVILNQ
ncbi:YkgJ family cysteine cluster protein [Helicobacter pylori]|uniref:YkgJ family cysteine cluster protein n=1 Tax=Helicobacter pylori TaxID=210 RepID=UPI00046D51A0|nr:YkgJ family cysteine cluster protein [Helicobacter pylori]